MTVSATAQAMMRSRSAAGRTACRCVPPPRVAAPPPLRRPSQWQRAQPPGSWGCLCSPPVAGLFTAFSTPWILFHRLFTAVLPLQNVRAIREAVGDEVDLMVHRAGGESSAILPALPSQSLLKRLRKGEGGA